MNFMRTAFAVAIVTLVIGFVGGHYLLTALFSSTASQGSTLVAAVPTVTATGTSAPTVTARPTATAQPTDTGTPRPAATTPVPASPTATIAVASTVTATAVPQVAAATKHHSRHHAPPAAAGGALSSAQPHRHTKRHHAAKPRPTVTPTPLPTPTTGIVTLVRYWVGSQVASPGQRIEVGYVIDNGTGQTQRIMLGASIKSSRTLGWTSGVVSDPALDVVAIVPPGVTSHARYFTLPASLHPGAYDVAWGLRNVVTDQRVALVAAPAALQVAK